MARSAVRFRLEMLHTRFPVVTGQRLDTLEHDVACPFIAGHVVAVRQILRIDVESGNLWTVAPVDRTVVVLAAANLAISRDLPLWNVARVYVHHVATVDLAILPVLAVAGTKPERPRKDRPAFAMVHPVSVSRVSAPPDPCPLDIAEVPSAEISVEGSLASEPIESTIERALHHREAIRIAG